MVYTVAHVAGSAGPCLFPRDLTQVVDDPRVVWNLVAWDQLEGRGSKHAPYTQDLLELDGCLPVAGRVTSKRLAEVNTPLQVSEWERALANHPDRQFVEYLLRGMREGFRIGYNHRGHTFPLHFQQNSVIWVHRHIAVG